MLLRRKFQEPTIVCCKTKAVERSCGAGRTKSNSKKEITKTSQIGTKEKETRATFIVNDGFRENEIIGLLGSNL
jgi:hypothetical protein